MTSAGEKQRTRAREGAGPNLPVHPGKGPRVFVSYAHHDGAQVERTVRFARNLAARGVDVRFDQFDPHPNAGWPMWMEEQVRDADWVLMACTGPWVSRFNGQRDSVGGRGVVWEGLLIRNVAYEAGGTATFIPVQFDDDRVRLPPLFRQRRVFVLDGDFDELVDTLTSRRALGEPRDITGYPVLEPIVHPVVVLTTPAFDEVAKDIAARLPAPTPIAMTDDVRGGMLERAAVVVVLGAELPPKLVRIANAPDRSVIHVDAAFSESLSAEAIAARVLARVRDAQNALARRWWSGAGVDMLGASLLLGVTPVAATVATARTSSGWGLWIALFVAAGMLALSGLARAMPDERLPIVHHRVEWRHFLIVLEESASLALGRLRRRELWRGSIGALSLLAVPPFAWLVNLPALSPHQLWWLALSVVAASILGMAALAVWLWRFRVGMMIALALTIIGLCVPNIEVLGTSLDGPVSDALRALFHIPIPTRPVDWVYTGAVSLPITLPAATLMATLLLRLFARGAVSSPRTLRWLAAAFALLGIAASQIG
jgi:hypothetical protein